MEKIVLENAKNVKLQREIVSTICASRVLLDEDMEFLTPYRSFIDDTSLETDGVIKKIAVGVGLICSLGALDFPSTMSFFAKSIVDTMIETRYFLCRKSYLKRVDYIIEMIKVVYKSTNLFRHHMDKIEALQRRFQVGPTTMYTPALTKYNGIILTHSDAIVRTLLRLCNRIHEKVPNTRPAIEYDQINIVHDKIVMHSLEGVLDLYVLASSHFLGALALACCPQTWRTDAEIDLNYVLDTVLRDAVAVLKRHSPYITDACERMTNDLEDARPAVATKTERKTYDNRSGLVPVEKTLAQLAVNLQLAFYKTVDIQKFCSDVQQEPTAVQWQTIGQGLEELCTQYRAIGLALDIAEKLHARCSPKTSIEQQKQQRTVTKESALDNIHVEANVAPLDVLEPNIIKDEEYIIYINDSDDDDETDSICFDHDRGESAPHHQIEALALMNELKTYLHNKKPLNDVNDRKDLELNDAANREASSTVPPPPRLPTVDASFVMSLKDILCKSKNVCVSDEMVFESSGSYEDDSSSDNCLKVDEERQDDEEQD